MLIRRHPAMLLRYVLEACGALILAGVLTSVVHQSTVLTVIWVGFLVVTSRLAFKVFEWSDEFFAVTNVRVMLVHGIVTRRVDMMPLSKVTDLTVDRTIMGRMLGYGTIVLESAGQDQALSTGGVRPRARNDLPGHLRRGLRPRRRLSGEPPSERSGR